MKPSVYHSTFIAFATLLSSLLSREPILAAGCPAPTFTAAGNFAVGTYPVAAAVSDFNKDGMADLAVANQQSENISVLLGNSDGTFQSAINYGAGTFPQFVAASDFNGDGKPDLAVANAFDPGS